MIETPRLVLRQWRSADAAALHAIRRDPQVVATLGAAPESADSDAIIARQNAHLAANGYCFWAATLRDTGRLAGWCGLQPGKSPIEGETEISWTLASDLWGRGLAREAAQAVLAWAWAQTGLARIFAITTPGNVRSWGLMERLGMTRVVDGAFDHPALPEGDPLRRHITHRIDRPKPDARG